MVGKILCCILGIGLFFNLDSYCQSISGYELTLAEKQFEGKPDAKQLYQSYFDQVKLAQSYNSSNLDSAQLLYLKCDSFLVANGQVGLHHRLLLDYGFQRSRIGDADEALRVCELLESENFNKKDYFLSFCFYRIKSQSFKAQSKLKEAIENALLAKKSLVDGDQTEKDSKKSAYNKFFLINIQSDLSNLFKDTQQFEKSAELQKSNVTTIQAIDNKMLELADKKENDKFLYLANSYNNLALTEITRIQNSENPQPDTNIVFYLNRAVEYSEQVNNLGFLGTAYYNLANYYNVIEDYPNRKSALEKSLEVNTIINNEIGLVYCKSDLSNTMIKLKQDPALALKYAGEALEVVRNNPDFGSRAGIYLTYCEALNYNGNVTEALAYFDSANIFKTQELKSTFDKEITEMQTKYETLEKEQEILKQDTEIKQKQSQMNLLYGGIGAFAIISFLAFRSYFQKKKANVIIQKEKDRSDNLLLNILPAETAEELKAYGKTTARSYDNCTVMFTDFVGFTNIAEKLTPQELVSEIDFCFKEFDEIISKYNIEKIKTIGDAYMCVANLPRENKQHAPDMVNAALDIRNFIQKLYDKRALQNEVSFKIRIGIHSGPLVAGVVGTKKFAYDVWGDTVNLASRMESSGEAGKVNISGATYELVKNKFNFVPRGKIEAKNKGTIDMFFVDRS